MEHIKKIPTQSDFVDSIKQLLSNLIDIKNYLITKWLIIIVFGVGGAAIGLGLSFIIKPKYTAKISFSLIEKSGSSSGLASLASSFGFGGLLGGGGGDAFSGDNLLEIIKSRYAVEKTLLCPVEFNGKLSTMADVYIEFNNLHEKWKNHKNKELSTLSYPIEQSRDKFSRTQDSVLNEFYEGFIKRGELSVIRKDKKISIVNVSFTSKNEVFSKLFVENLMSQTYSYYKETRTSQSKANIEMMQHTADSIKSLYEGSLYKSAGISQVNINRAIQTAAVPRIQSENNAQLYGTVYAEVLKNLETLKLELARETPLVQIIDNPRYPLKKEKLGKAKGLVLGGFFGGFIIVFFLLGKRYFRDFIKNN